MHESLLYTGLTLTAVSMSIILVLYMMNRSASKKLEAKTICRPYSLEKRLGELERLKEDVERYYNLRFKIALIEQHKSLAPIIENNQKILQKCRRAIEGANDPEVIMRQVSVAKGIYEWFEEQNSLHPNLLFINAFDNGAEFEEFKRFVNSRISEVALYKANHYERKIFILVTNGPKLTLTQRTFVEIDTLRELAYLESENGEATIESLNNIHYKIEDLYSKSIQ